MVKKLLTIALGLTLAFSAAAQTGNNEGHEIPQGRKSVSFPASDIQYWVGTGSNSAVVIIGWDDNPNGNFALAWGVHWNGSAMAVNMLDTIATYDGRVAYAISSGFVTNIGYNDGTLVSGSSASYWCYTINGGYAGAYGSQSMANGDVMEISSSCMFSLTTATAATDPNPTPEPPADPVDASIAFSDILFWVGEGSHEAVLAVNWADTALAWGYRFSADSVSSATMMADIAAADPRLSLVGEGYIDDIRFIDTAAGMTDTLGITPGNWWSSLLNGYSDMGSGQILHHGDLQKWGDPAAGAIVDSMEYNGWWYYSYVFPMTIHPVTVPDTTSDTPGPVDPDHGPFCGAVGTEGCTAIAANSDAIVGWATACSLDLGPQNIAVEGSPLVTYGTADDAIGPCTMNDNLSVVSLGDGGSALLTFAHPISNGEGPDFAVFENSFNDSFLELAFVEVSSDGSRFVRFPATSLTQTETQASAVDPTFINNLAGKYRTGYGTPFDLEELRDSTGINIDSIVYVRVIDVVGSINPLYATYDAFGHIVNDPWPTNSWSSGFDLDGIAVMHERTGTTPVDSLPEEATIAASDILYWVGEGSNEVVMAVNWADTALAWGYRFNGSKTVGDMMTDIAAADPRFSYTLADGYLADILFIVHEGDTLRRQPSGWWESKNNGFTDAGLAQPLTGGDFEKWAEPAAGVIVDSMEYNGYWYYSYVYPMAIHPVTVPDTTEGIDELTILNSQLSVYPNPAADVVNVSVSRAAEAVLYDLAGRRMATLTLREGINTLDLNHLNSGIYMLRIEGTVSKIVKR